MAQIDNQFQVRKQGADRVRIGTSASGPILGEVTVEQALNLAAWVIALCDPGQEQIDKLVDDIVMERKT
jgi:hypothetical protein